MKTIREWLEELPEPQRSEALENCKAQKTPTAYRVKTKKLAVDSFDWENSPQKFDYWDKIYDSL